MERFLHGPFRTLAGTLGQVSSPIYLNAESDKMQDMRLALKPHVILERDSDEDDIVLIDSKSGRMSACNETASLVVGELQNGSTLASLVEKLMTTFKVTDDVAIRDVNTLLDLLAAEGLLETAE